MPHIHTAPGQHDQTTSAYIVRLQDDEAYLLLHRHRKYGKLMQPGGHVELHEYAWQTILRELPEETGYEASQLDVLQPPIQVLTAYAPNTVLLPLPISLNSHRVPADNVVTEHYHDDVVYAFLAHDSPAHNPDEGESSELVWVTLEQLRALQDEDLLPAVKEIGEFVLTTCLAVWKPVSIRHFSTAQPGLL